MRSATDRPVGRLLRRADFLAAAGGARAHTALFTLQARLRPDCVDCDPRLGFTVTRKAGGAVERNRMRRRLREAVRQIAPQSALAGHDYVIVARNTVLTATFDHILADLKSAFRRVHTAKTGPAPARTPRN